jgi:iron complex outermembrane receptor protein
MNYQLSYSWKQKLVITGHYSKTKDFFAKIVEIIEDDRTQIIPRNMEKSINYGISMSYPLTITEFWELMAFGNASRQIYKGDLEGTVIDLETTLWNYQIQNIFNLPEGFLMDITFSQRSKWIWRGSVFIEGSESLSFGIRKDFLDKKLQLRFTGSDILRTASDYPYYSDYGGIDLDGVYTDDGRRFGLGATFKFGNQQSKSKKKVKSGLDDELDRIVN